jgi:peptidoglycan hydrolase-like protein with peptidoglycan-binding domain
MRGLLLMRERFGRGARLGCLSALTVGMALVTAACGGTTQVDGVSAAQAKVDSATKAQAEAKVAFDKASAGFCGDSKTYITALDGYGKAFDDKAATVGDVRKAGSDLVKPREAVTTSAQGVTDTKDALTKAEKDLAQAEADLAQARSSASGSAANASTTTTRPTTTTTLVPPASVDRVKKAEADLAATTEGITDQTPLLQATASFNAAAFTLEVAWLRLFADAGCLTGDQRVQADAAVRQYTVELQKNLQTAGFYTGDVDGLYGPSTVAAVEALQKSAGLPVTGLVDQATSAALDAAVAAKGGAAASQVAAQTAAVQSTLKLAGYWTGPVDGKWTPELTDALKKFQTDLGVPATGAVDAATLQALEKAIAKGQRGSESSATTTTTARGATSTTTTTMKAPS